MISNRTRIVFALLLAIISISGIVKLKVTPDTRVLLNPNDANVINLRQFEDTFNTHNIVAFVVTCETITPHCRATLPELVQIITSEARNLPYAVKASSLSTVPILGADEDSIVVKTYLEKYCLPYCPPGFHSAVEYPESVKRYINDDATSFGIYASLNFDSSSVQAVEEIYTAAQNLISEVSTTSDVTIRFVGRVPMMQAFVDATNDELTGLMGAALLVIFLVVWATFSNLRLTLILISLSVLTILSTLGLAGWFGLVVSTATAALPSIILTLTTATAMHYFMQVIRVMSEDALRNQKEVAAGAVSYQLAPTLITAATTILAMASMVTVDSPPFQQLGVWTAVSLAYACVYLFVLVPPAIGFLPAIRPSRWQQTLQPILNKHARYINSRKKLAISCLLACIFCGSAILQLEVDDDFVRYFGTDTSFRQDTEFASTNLIGPTNIEIVVDSGTPGGVYRASYLKDIESLVNALRAEDLIDSVTSVVDIIDPISRSFGELDWREQSSEAIAQLLFSYEISLEEGQSVNDFLDPAFQKSRISVVAKDISSNGIARLNEHIMTLTESGEAESTYTVTGEAIPLAYLSRKNIPGIMVSLLFVLVFVSTSLGVYFRSLRISVLLAATTIIPVLCGFGFWSMFSPSLGLATTVILSVCMGVVIDDSIHMVFRYQDGLKRLNLEPTEAASYAVHRVGNAISTTTLILVLGFGVLSFSSFEINRTFGICTVLILMAALVIDLLILPSLLPSRGQTSKESGQRQYDGRE